MAHFINILCSVILGPWYSLLCAILIGVIRMFFMGIPPLALTGAVFGAFFSGVLYRVSKGKLICAIIGEVIGTGIIGAIVSYPIMTFIWGRTGLTWMFYVPSFIMATFIGGTIAFIFLGALSRTGNLAKIQRSLGQKFMANQELIINKLLQIRQSVKFKKPLIHYITNPISINDCANMILAVGAKPLWPSILWKFPKSLLFQNLLELTLGI